MVPTESCCKSNRGDNMLKLFLANTRSAKGKAPEITALTNDFDIICLTETHIDDTVPNNCIIEAPDKKVFRRDRTLYGGGVLIAVNDNLKPRELIIDDLGEEILFIGFEPKTIICCLYRPYVHLKNMNNLRAILESVTEKYPEHILILTGDFNLPGINWNLRQLKHDCQHKQIHSEFLDILNDFMLDQIITEPTHIMGNTLDLLCTNTPGYILQTDIIQPGLSDHYIISATLKPIVQRLSSKTHIAVKKYKEADDEAFHENMQKLSMDLATMEDPNDMWKLFTNQLQQNIEACVPTKEIKRINANQPNWFGTDAEKLISKQRRTYRKYKQTGDPFFLEKYRQERKITKKEVRRMKTSFLVDNICGPLKRGNSKPFFRHLRNKKTGSAPSINLKTNDQQSTDDPAECADLLNNFFQEQFCKNHCIDGVPPLDSFNDNIEISDDGVEKLIISLGNGKSPGPDGLRKPDLMIDIPTTAACLSHIYRASIKSGKLPDQWKMAYVTPIHKGGDPDQVSNYRPISLTSIPCKMLEHIVLHHINKKLDSYLHHRQHGFRRGLSCDTQLCATFHDLAKSLEQNKTTHAVILDFKKAFDKVPHSLLLQKLRAIPGLDPVLINWIQDFITGRKQRVVLQNSKSRVCSVTSGVPQGSVLGPTLFLVYINDLPDTLTCSVSLYADDTLLYQDVTSDQDSAKFQRNIDAVQKWSQKWMMPFNINKCHAMAFDTGNNNITPAYKLGTTDIPWTTNTRYLGVTLQHDLKFDQHVSKKTDKASKILGAIKHTLHGTPSKCRLLAYVSLCRPVLEYADTLWDPTSRQTIDQIENIQRRAVRFISNLKGRDSVTEERDLLELAPLETRRRNHRVTLLHKILTDEERHSTLSASYDEIVESRANVSMTTRAASRGELMSISATNRVYHNSFLPRTIRDMRINTPE